MVKRTRITATILALFLMALPARAEPDITVAQFARDLVPERVSGALSQITDEGRQLLALRNYLRSSKILEERWSWSEAEIEAFRDSDEAVALNAEIAAVNAHFSAANPGSEIYVHSRIHSLDTQIEHWNENEPVGVAADEILTAWRAELTNLTAADGTLDAKATAHWLKRFKPAKRANLAAPGLSLHGRAHAIDFQIKKDGKIIASTDSSEIETVWQKQGWEAQLKARIDAAGPSFSGPLQSPHEPWHYDYEPSTRVSPTN